MYKIAVNLVTGFLGVGKTTAVRHLLEQHPAGVRWAVLVNEFGEVGVDGALIERPDVQVQEVVGGCLCCVAAPAFTTGLNRLIRQYRPERILIEPSGLGHPAQVLQTLTGPLYADLLDVRATLCLMDARHLGSPRHREHPNFQDQIHLADLLVANKIDLYSAVDRTAFEAFVATLDPPKQRLGYVERGRVEPAWLDLPRSTGRRAAFPEAHAFLQAGEAVGDHRHVPDRPDWLMLEGQGDDYYRVGWIVRGTPPWPHDALRDYLQGLGVERRKGLLPTDRGWRSLNQDDWSVARAPADRRARLELIDHRPLDAAAIDGALRRLSTR